jgi:hypothetical protein
VLLFKDVLDVRRTRRENRRRITISNNRNAIHFDGKLISQVEGGVKPGVNEDSPQVIVSPNVITVEADIEPCPTETHVLPRRERIDNEIDKIEVIEPNVQQEDARISTMVSRDNRWYVSLNVLGTPIIGLVDTGATYSYMSSQLQNCFKAFAFIYL